MERRPSNDVRQPMYGEWDNWIAARCPACFSRRAEIVRGFHAPLSTQPWRIVRCLECSQMYTDPQPPAEAWEDLYPADYPPHQVKPAKARERSGWRRLMGRWIRSGGPEEETLLSLRKRISATFFPSLLGYRIDPYLMPPKRYKDGSQCRLLDVGCGSGKYLARMKSLGWDVLGIDYSERAARSAQAAYGVKVLVGTVPSKQLPLASFDLITAWQVLEHLQRPRQALAGIRALLKPNGRFVLSVPNQGSWAAGYFGPDWIGLDVPRHLTHFTPATLRAILQAEGFQVLHLSTICHSGWIRQSAREALRHQKSRRMRLLTSHTVSSLVSRWARRTKQAESIYAVASLPNPRPIGMKLDRQV